MLFELNQMPTQLKRLCICICKREIERYALQRIDWKMFGFMMPVWEIHAERFNKVSTGSMVVIWLGNVHLSEDG